MLQLARQRRTFSCLLRTFQIHGVIFSDVLILQFPCRTLIYIMAHLKCYMWKSQIEKSIGQCLITLKCYGLQREYYVTLLHDGANYSCRRNLNLRDQSQSTPLKKIISAERSLFTGVHLNKNQSINQKSSTPGLSVTVSHDSFLDI